jgi:glucose-6-phosphate 1-dehydrogenase
MPLSLVDIKSEDQEYLISSPVPGCERLLQDCMSGDQTLFQCADTVEAGPPVVN